MKRIYILSCALLICCVLSPAPAVEISPAEREAARNWVNAKFEAQTPDLSRQSGILVRANNVPPNPCNVSVKSVQCCSE